MGLNHAIAGEAVDLNTWGSEVGSGKAKTIAKTERVELILIDLPAGRELPEHKAPGFITVQCVKGAVEFYCKDKMVLLKRDHLLYLEPGEPHSVKCGEDSAILLTVIR